MNPMDSLSAALAGGILLSLIFALIGLVYILLWVIGLVHCLKHCHTKDRTMWVLVIILVPFGYLFYYTMGRNSVPPIQSVPSYAGGAGLPAHSPTQDVPSGGLRAVQFRPAIDFASPPFDVRDMDDEKKRAASINAALTAMAKSSRSAKSVDRA